MEKLKAVAYCRVSTIMQEEGRSLEFQIKKCQDYCEFQNYELIEIIQDVESGGNDDREGFLKLIQKVKSKEFNVLVVFESSRISRVTLTMLNFVLELQKSNIHFISISQPELNTTTPTGMLFFTIQATLSEYERKQISVRVKSNKWARAKAGIWQGGKLPLGYKKDPENNDIILIDEENAIIIKELFEYYLSSKSIKKTANIFNKHPGSVQWILSNPFYTGLFRYGKKENNINTGIVKVNEDYQYFEGVHQPIISREIFNQVQSLMKSSGIGTKKSSPLLFSGILRCECGGKMYSSNNGKSLLYRCDYCQKAVGKKKIEEKILKDLFELNELSELNEVSLIKKKTEHELSIINKSLSKLDNERQKYITLFTKEMISEEEFNNFVKLLKERKLFLEEEKNNLINLLSSDEKQQKKIDNVSLLKEVINNLSSDDTDEIYTVFKMLIDRIEIVNRNPLEIKIYIAD